MNVFTLLILLFVCVAGAISGDSDHYDHHDYHDDDRHHDHHDGHDQDRHHDDYHDYAGPQGVTEGDIIRDLKARRVKYGAPQWDGPPDIGVGMYVESVLGVNAEKGYMEMSGYLSLTWTDPRLRFRYSHPFHEVKAVRLSKDDVWLPDIEVYNQMSRGIGISSSVPVHVMFNGSVTWTPLITIRSLCPVRPDHSDETKCEMKFGSWTYHGNLLDVHVMDSMNSLTYYEPTGQWEVTNVTSKRISVKFSCCADNYVYISSVFNLKKRDI